MIRAHYLNAFAPRQWFLLGGSALLLGITALTIFWIKPLYERYSASQTDVATLENLVGLGPVGSLAPLEQEIARYERELLGDMHGIPLKQLEAHIIGALQHNVWSSEVDLLTIEPQENSSAAPHEEIAFRLEISGTYFNLADWMEQVNQQLGFVVIKEYTFVGKRDAPDPILNARVLLAAYRVGTT